MLGQVIAAAGGPFVRQGGRPTPRIAPRENARRRLCQHQTAMGGRCVGPSAGRALK